MRAERQIPTEARSPNTILGVLKQTAHEVSFFDDQARLSRYLKRDAETYRGMIRARTRILVNLPTKLEALSETGVEIPTEVMQNALSWSYYAQLNIETNNYMGMLAILTPMGSKKDDPNELKKLIQKLENPKN